MTRLPPPTPIMRATGELRRHESMIVAIVVVTRGGTSVSLLVNHRIYCILLKFSFSNSMFIFHIVSFGELLFLLKFIIVDFS